MLTEASRVPVAPALRSLMARRAEAEAATEGRGLPEPGGDRSHRKQLGGLVLTRHLDESIMIGDDVEVQVVGIKAGTVRIKVVAPRSIPVHRREVFDAIQLTPPTVQTIEPAVPRAGKPSGGLVLTRAAHQSIMVGDQVEIVIVDIRPTTVKIKVAAPKSVVVHRREVFDSIRAERA